MYNIFDLYTLMFSSEELIMNVKRYTEHLDLLDLAKPQLDLVRRS